VRFPILNKTLVVHASKLPIIMLDMLVAYAARLLFRRIHVFLTKSIAIGLLVAHQDFLLGLRLELLNLNLIDANHFLAHTCVVLERLPSDICYFKFAQLIFIFTLSEILRVFHLTLLYHFGVCALGSHCKGLK
jgi:hypothetical protein